MQIVRLACVTAALFAIGACSAVYVQEPIGAQVLRLEEEDWEGTWVAADGETAIVGVRDAEAGILWVGGLEERDGEPAIELLTVYLRDATREGGERLLVSIEDDDRYVWGLLVRDGDYAVLYGPEIGKFRALVTEGKLPGRIGSNGDDNNVYLGKLQPEHVEMILAGDVGVLFDWDDPYVFHRVAR